jgi:large subunit ribosomal protein L6
MLGDALLHIIIKMRKQLSQTIEIPEGIKVSIKDDEVNVNGPEGEVNRRFDLGDLEFKIKGKEVIIGHEKATKKEKRMINTITARVRNMIRGVQRKFEYTLKIASSHFPMTVKIEGNNAIIKNYYGEKIDRKTKIPKGVEVEINKDIITIKSTNKELAGQAAANFENVTKVRNRDRRTFQDGIYIIKKDDKEI